MGKPNVVNLFADVYCGEHNLFICVFIIAKGAMMDIENRATKIMLKNMPVFLAEELIALYKIKTPYKEILIETCINDKCQFEAMRELTKKGIHLGFRTFSRKQARALEMFRIAHTLYKRRGQDAQA